MADDDLPPPFVPAPDRGPLPVPVNHWPPPPAAPPVSVGIDVGTPWHSTEVDIGDAADSPRARRLRVRPLTVGVGLVAVLGWVAVTTSATTTAGDESTGPTSVSIAATTSSTTASMAGVGTAAAATTSASVSTASISETTPSTIVATIAAPTTLLATTTTQPAPTDPPVASTQPAPPPTQPAPVTSPLPPPPPTVPATQPPAPVQPLAESLPPRSGCHASYADACLMIGSGDYDCAGGKGNGPNYTGRVRVVGDDEFGLDRDGDGVGCE